MENKAACIQDLLGITQEEVACLIDVNAEALAMHVTETKKLSFDKCKTLDILCSCSKSAANNRKAFHIPESQAAKQKSIMELLQQNEQQQKLLIPKIRIEELSQKQQLTKRSFVRLLTLGSDHEELPFVKLLKGIMAKTSTHDFKKSLYSNQIKLKMLKYEIRLLEQDLQSVIDTTEKAA